MLEALKLIFQENWEWRKQILNLAVMDIVKTMRGAVLGWVWLFVKPLSYIFVFWFALNLGLKAGNTVGDYPYLLWLVAGLVPWFFMSDALTTGANVFRRYPFLVNRIKFPLSSISAFYILSQFFIMLMVFALVLIASLFLGCSFDIHIIQFFVLLFVMLAFWTCFSTLASPLSAISKDFLNLLKAASTPIFWISGIIFNIDSLNIPILHAILAFNPVTFFATGFRASLCDKYWLWERPEVLIPFFVVFVLTFVAMLFVYARLRKDVADVL